MRQHSPTRNDAWVRLLGKAILAAALSAAGCSLPGQSRLRESIQTIKEPELGGEYLLYRPSLYDSAQDWPVFVVCAGGVSDSPRKQMSAWAPVGESKGVLVIAPRLESTGWSLRRNADRQRELLRADEERILAAVRNVQAGQHVSEDRIFIYGWGGGAPAALHTGLRHPEVFRAVAVAQPAYDEAALAGAAACLDPYQPVFVHYRATDVLYGKDGQRCADWLTDRSPVVTTDSFGPLQWDKCDGVVDFFEEVLRTRPLVRIGVSTPDPADPQTVQFKVRCSHEPRRFRWEFGDGSTSPVAEPRYRYSSAGTYVVRVTVDGPRGQTLHRAVELTIPGLLVRPLFVDEKSSQPGG
ncbi:MAG TPA: PKD domain-containing protein [Phycisphaerae bacterium]|nr:PKD domain-containing protein [Phycisphaerae bacterium]HNU46025.1 PKD domain-containing protein [Phycisphaerae bacterium]